jgi:hypothetical protein
MSEAIRRFEEGYVQPHKHHCAMSCKEYRQTHCGHDGVRLVTRPSLVLRRTRSYTRHCGVPMLRVLVFEPWKCAYPRCEYRGAMERPRLHAYCEVCNHLEEIGNW